MKDKDKKANKLKNKINKSFQEEEFEIVFENNNIDDNASSKIKDIRLKNESKDFNDKKNNREAKDGKDKKNKSTNFNETKSNKDNKEIKENYDMNTLESLNQKYKKVDVNKNDYNKNEEYITKNERKKISKDDKKIENVKKDKQINSDINSKNNNMSNKPKQTIPVVNFRSFLDSKILFNEALNSLSTESHPDNVAETILICIGEFADEIYNNLDEKTRKKISKESFIADNIDTDKFRESLYSYISEISYNVLDDIKYSLKENLRQLKMEVKLNCYNSNFNEDELKIVCNVEDKNSDFKEKVQININEIEKLNNKLRLCKNEHFKFFKETTQNYFIDNNIILDNNTDFFNSYKIVTEVSNQDYNQIELEKNVSLNVKINDNNIHTSNIISTDKNKFVDAKDFVNINIENQWLSTFKKIQESNTVEKNINSLIYNEKLEFKKLEEEILMLEQCEVMNEKYFDQGKNASEMLKILNNIYV